MLRKTFLFAIPLLIFCCSEKKSKPETNGTSYGKGTFGYDLEFLQANDDVVVLKNKDAQVIVSAKYQGKVFTSTADGMKGKSFGWINYAAFDSLIDPHMNAYGGENRLWLGPEGNRFSIFFRPGSDMIFENWVTPAAFDTEPWKIESSDDRQVTLSKKTELTNYIRSKFNVRIDRVISIIDSTAMDTLLFPGVYTNVKAVGYTTRNKITNEGDKRWTKETGAPCIWILDMFTPSPSTSVLVPYNDRTSGKIVTTDYFGEIPSDRISIGKNIITFKADGKSRGKIGLTPRRARTYAASYDPENNMLTIVTFTVDPKGVYLNQEWKLTKDPYTGDAVNAYNDGPLENGTQLGPFYELESTSPAAFLAPGESLVHFHNVFHFTGKREALQGILTQLFKDLSF